MEREAEGTKVRSGQSRVVGLEANPPAYKTGTAKDSEGVSIQPVTSSSSGQPLCPPRALGRVTY